MPVNPQDIDAICDLVVDLCGVYLDERKVYLIESRLSDLLRRSGCQDYAQLARRVRSQGDRDLENAIIDAITTHETLFFRDGSPFEALKHKALPELIDTKEHSPHPHRLRIWSAACSTGQEPYSIGITVRELLGDLSAWDISILATDISDAAISKASRGCYTDRELKRGMPRELVDRHFTRDGNLWKIRDEIRALVSFRKQNLLEPFHGLGPFDVVFCRNVAIYFTPEIRHDLFERLTKTLTPTGYLFTGAAESLTDLGPRFRPQHHCRSVFYQPNLPATARA